MNNKGYLAGLIVSMVMFGMLAIAFWVAGFMGHTHQFFWAVICTLAVIANAIEYKQLKKS